MMIFDVYASTLKDLSSSTWISSIFRIYGLLFTAIDRLSDFELEDVTKEYLETISSLGIRYQQQKNWNVLRHIFDENSIN